MNLQRERRSKLHSGGQSVQGAEALNSLSLGRQSGSGSTSLADASIAQELG